MNRQELSRGIGAYLRAYQAGHVARGEEAFTAIYLELSEALCGELERRGASRDEAEQFASDAIMRSLERAKTYDPAKSEGWAWLAKIAVNTWYSHLRRKPRGSVLSIGESEADTEGQPTAISEDDLPDPYADPTESDARLDSWFEVGKLKQAIQRLPLPTRHYAQVFVREGGDVKRTAALCDVGEERIRQIRRLLRTMLQDPA